MQEVLNQADNFTNNCAEHLSKLVFYTKITESPYLSLLCDHLLSAP